MGIYTPALLSSLKTACGLKYDSFFCIFQAEGFSPDLDVAAEVEVETSSDEVIDIEYVTTDATEDSSSSSEDSDTDEAAQGDVSASETSGATSGASDSYDAVVIDLQLRLVPRLKRKVGNFKGHFVNLFCSSSTVARRLIRKSTWNTKKKSRFTSD